jgi:hypothetical protein
MINRSPDNRCSTVCSFTSINQYRECAEDNCVLVDMWFVLGLCNIYLTVHVCCYQGEMGTPGFVGPPGVQGYEGEPGVYDPDLDEPGGPGVIGPQGPLGLYPSN